MATTFYKRGPVPVKVPDSPVVVGPPTTSKVPAGTSAPVSTSYDPKNGPPTWDANGGGTAKTQEEFNQQADAFRSYNQQSGLTDANGANVHAYGAGMPTVEERRAAAPPAPQLAPQPAAPQPGTMQQRDPLRPPTSTAPVSQPTGPMIMPTNGGRQGPVLMAPPAPTVTAGGAAAAPATSAITGDETPYTVNPSQSGELQGLLSQLRGMVGGGGTSGDPEVQAALKKSALDQINNPDVYGTDLMQAAMDQGKRQLDSYYGGLSQTLKNDLGARGIAYSDVAKDDFNSLASEAGRAYQDMIRPILQQRAQALGSARTAAFNNASSLEDQSLRRNSQVFNQLADVTGMQSGIESGLRDEQRGERAYVDNLRDKARDQSIEEMLLGENIRRGREGDYQDALQRALATGDPAAIQAALAGSAGYYGDQASDGADSLQALAQLFMQNRAAA